MAVDDIDGLCAVEEEGIMGVITGRAIYEGTLDFAAAQARADAVSTAEPADPGCWPNASFPASMSPPGASSRRQFRRAARRRRSGRDRRALRRAGRGRTHLPRHHGQPDDRARHHPARGRAGRRARFSSAHRRRRCAQRSRTCATLLNAGADKVSINTAAVEQPQLVHDASSKVGSKRVVRDRRQTGQQTAPGVGGGIHPRRRNNTGWTPLSGPKVEIAGGGRILLTSMDRRHQERFRSGLTRAVSDAVRIPVIASGGVGTWSI